MENLFIFFSAFVIIFIILLINYVIKKHQNKLKDSKEINLLVGRYKLKREKLNYEKVGLITTIANSFIIALTGTISGIFNLHYIWQLVIGFTLLISLIYVIYGFIGIILKRKERKNGKFKTN